MITEEEYIHKCEFKCPKCKAIIRPSKMEQTYAELLMKKGEEAADAIIKDAVDNYKNHHFRLHDIEEIFDEEGVRDDEIGIVESDIRIVISIRRLEQRFGEAKISFGDKKAEHGAYKQRVYPEDKNIVDY